MRMTQEELDKYNARMRRGNPRPLNKLKIKKKNKYNAIPKILDNYIFHSISESQYYERCKWRVKAGELLYFLRQVPLHLPGGVKIIVDFMLVYADGRIEFIDVKGGKPTEAWRVKQRIAEATYPIKIRIVRKDKKGEFRLYGEI